MNLNINGKFAKVLNRKSCRKISYLYLPLHCYTEECYEIHNEYGPEYWYVKTIKQCAYHGNNRRPCY